MGFPPAEVDRMSVWEFMACAEGYRLSQGGEAGSAALPADLDERMAASGIEGF